LDLDANSFAALSPERDETICNDLDISDRSFKQTEYTKIVLGQVLVHESGFSELRGAESAEDARKAKTHLGIGQIDAQAMAAAFRKRDKVFVETRILEPPLWPEFFRIREYGFIVV